MIAIQQTTAAERAGYDFYFESVGCRNPYPRGTTEFGDWQRGYERARREHELVPARVGMVKHHPSRSMTRREKQQAETRRARKLSEM